MYIVSEIFQFIGGWPTWLVVSVLFGCLAFAVEGSVVRLSAAAVGITCMGFAILGAPNQIDKSIGLLDSILSIRVVVHRSVLDVTDIPKKESIISIDVPTNYYFEGASFVKRSLYADQRERGNTILVLQLKDISDEKSRAWQCLPSRNNLWAWLEGGDAIHNVAIQQVTATGERINVASLADQRTKEQWICLRIYEGPHTAIAPFPGR